MAKSNENEESADDRFAWKPEDIVIIKADDLDESNIKWEPGQGVH